MPMSMGAFIGELLIGVLPMEKRKTPIYNEVEIHLFSERGVSDMKYKNTRRNILIGWAVAGALVVLAIAVASGRPEWQPGVTKLVNAFGAGSVAVMMASSILHEKAEDVEKPAAVHPYRKIRWTIGALYAALCMIMWLVPAYVIGRPDTKLPFGPIIGAFVAIGLVAAGVVLYLEHKEKKMNQ